MGQEKHQKHIFMVSVRFSISLNSRRSGVSLTNYVEAVRCILIECEPVVTHETLTWDKFP